MFLLTGAAHFNRMRADLVRMVSPALPRPELLVTLTGIAELAGAVGLLVPAWASAAALALALLLVALFPANVHAARASVTLGGRDATALWLRAPMQLIWVAMLVWIGLG